MWCADQEKASYLDTLTAQIGKRRITMDREYGFLQEEGANEV
jgi:hypothetical protein